MFSLFNLAIDHFRELTKMVFNHIFTVFTWYHCLLYYLIKILPPFITQYRHKFSSTPILSIIFVCMPNIIKYTFCIISYFCRSLDHFRELAKMVLTLMYHFVFSMGYKLLCHSPFGLILFLYFHLYQSYICCYFLKNLILLFLDDHIYYFCLHLL